MSATLTSRTVGTSHPAPPRHTAVNMPGEMADHDAFAGDRVLRELLARDGAGWAGWAAERASRVGTLVGSARVRELARLANDHEPTLRSHDRFGQRIDEVDYHPAYHELMTLARSGRNGSRACSRAPTTRASCARRTRAASTSRCR